MVQIALGQNVLSSDGQKIGVIERVVLSPSGNVVEHFVIHHGITLQDDMVVARVDIDRVDAHGVHLLLDADSTRTLPRFDYSFAGAEIEIDDLGLNNPFQGALFLPNLPLAAPEASETDAPARDRDASPTSEASRSTGVTIGKGADVISGDGRRIGSVHEVEYAEDGSLQSVTVQTGILRHHRFTIPAGSIAAIGDEEIVLTVPAGQLPESD